MALDNKYNDFPKYKGKIKIRNLDPEVISLINTGGSSGGSGYDDTAIKNDIKEIHDTLETHDDLINNINTKISTAATKTELNQFRRKDIDITYNDLDSDLKEKINNSGGSSSDVDLSDINNQLEALQSKVTLNTGNINNNTSNINILSDLFNTYKTEALNQETAQNNLINSNTNRIQQLENSINGSADSDINIGDLNDELANKINQIDNLTTNLSSLSQKVETNILNINSIQANTDSIEKDLNDFSIDVNENIDNLTNILDTANNNINSLNDELHSLTIDKIISFTNTAENPDNGKIDIDNLTSELSDKINNVSNFSSDIEQIRDTISYPGKNVNGSNGDFIYKNNDYLSTKPIFNFISIANTPEDVANLQALNKNLIYDKTNDILYKATTVDETDSGENTYSTVWQEVDDALLNNEFVSSFMYDSDNNGTLYFNNIGTLLELITFKDLKVGSWSFSTSSDGDILQLKYNDEILQEWAISDDLPENTSLQRQSFSLSSIKNSKQDNIFTISAKSSYLLNIDTNKILNILVLDNDKNSVSYGLYIVPINICTIAYVKDGIKIFNLTDKTITIKVLNN